MNADPGLQYNFKNGARFSSRSPIHVYIRRYVKSLDIEIRNVDIKMLTYLLKNTLIFVVQGAQMNSTLRAVDIDT
jgi:hypothetical protein